MLLGAIAAAIAYFSLLGDISSAYFMAGILFGLLVRDFAVGRMQVNMWLIQMKLFDWEKVERMARGEWIS